MEYRKRIEVSSTGMVIAEVFDDKGERKGLQFYSSFIFDSNEKVEKRCKKAHKWADERIEVCKRQEVNDIKLIVDNS